MRYVLRIVGATGLVLGGLVGASGCASKIPRDALAMRGPTTQIRSMTTRLFDTADETMMLSAVAGLLQDVGFTLDDSETDLGLIVASKDRSAVDSGQVAGKILAAVILRTNVAIDKEQKFRASVVTCPKGDKMAVRVTFQRIVWNDRGQVSRLEMLEEPEMYQEFFTKLSKAVFLEAHEI